MDTTKVIIENWPTTNYLLMYIPIVIALIALVVSLCSARLTRISFVISNRPYVWALTFASIDPANNMVVTHPCKVLFSVTNSPARIICMEINITINGEMLFTYAEKNLVRFPHEKNQWSFEMGKEDFDKIMNRANEEKSKLVRLISLKYSSLDGGKIYNFDLRQNFNPMDNQWKDINEKAD